MKNRRLIFFAIIVIALGVVLTTLVQANRAFGVVLIGIGGIFFIVGMKQKKEEDEEKDSD